MTECKLANEETGLIALKVQQGEKMLRRLNINGRATLNGTSRKLKNLKRFAMN